MLDKLAHFADQPTVSPMYVQSGNTPWAQRYSQELTDVVKRFAARSPRNLQRHLGPSELGHHCDRQLVGKMAGTTFGSGGGNLLHDPWASIVGTALHAYLEEAFRWEAQWHGDRWIAEQRVTPDPGALQPHPGTADLYDKTYATLVDHKCQSEAIRTRLRRDGPPFHYYVQMLLYGVGYMHMGYRVDRVALVSWPRTKSTLDDIFVWEHAVTADDLRLVLEVLDKTVIREELAVFVATGTMSFWDVPATPSDEDCQFCPFYNPAALGERTSKGCPGTSLKTSRHGA